MAKVTLFKTKEVDLGSNLDADQRAKLVRAILDFGGGRYVGLNFARKDGTRRSAVVNPMDFGRDMIKGDAASPSAQRAVATRRRNNPDLLNLVDHSGNSRNFISVRCRGQIILSQRRNGELVTKVVDLGA